MGWVIGASAAFGIGGAWMKSADGFEHVVPAALAIAAFVIGALLLIVAVREQGLTSAYTVGLGVEALISVGLGRWMFGERLHTPQTVGVLLIVAGAGALRLG